MNTIELIKHTEKAGTHITKDKLLEAIRRSGEKHYSFIQDTNGKYALVKVPL